MTEYTLYLDESYNVERKQFLVAGFAIDLNKIDIVDKGIESIKNILWNNVSEDFDNVVLHCTEIMNIYNNRKNPNLKRNINRNGYEKFLEYTPEDLKNKIENMNIELCKIVRNQEITVFGCLIDEDILDLYYGNKSQHDDKYFNKKEI